MAAEHDSEQTESRSQMGTLRVAIALAMLAAVGTGIAITQILERRLTKPEIARLKFYKYLRERGRLES
jgi:hypothetical protein